MLGECAVEGDGGVEVEVEMVKCLSWALRVLFLVVGGAVGLGEEDEGWGEGEEEDRDWEPYTDLIYWSRYN